MHSDEHLATFSEHVVYEMAMLVGIPRKLQATSDDVTRNALLESFAIHARQLVHFFYGHAKDGEIVASDYFNIPIPEWKMVRGKEDSGLKELVARVGDEIAHLTLKRMEPKKDWNLVSIVGEIGNRCGVFLQHVRPDRINTLDKERYLGMLSEHNAWLATLPSCATISGWTDLPRSTKVHPITSVSSGLNMTGKTCPPENRSVDADIDRPGLTRRGFLLLFLHLHLLIDPARALAAEALQLERQAGNLVNEARGVSSRQVTLNFGRISVERKGCY